MNTNITSIQYVNHTSLLINYGEGLLLTDPWHDTPAFGKWLPVPPPFMHPVYLTALAKNNESNFNILISNPDDDRCDDNFLKFFPKNINIIIPKNESPWFRRRIERLGFNNIVEIGKRQKFSNIDFRTHINGAVSIETNDALIIHSNKNNTFSEECMVSIDNHIQDYKSRTEYLKHDSSKILLATEINPSQNDYPNTYSDYDDEEKCEVFLTNFINKLFISTINMGIRNLLPYGGHDNYHINNKKTGGHKDLSFYREIAKEHLEKKINLIEILPGDKYDFKKVTPLFSDFKYRHEDLEIKSKEYYE